MPPKNKFFKDGIRFKCQGSGRCCVSRGEYGFVYLSPNDRKRLARHLDLSERGFLDKFCQETDGFVHLKTSQSVECLFLKNNRCEVYNARPTQCKTWPFWPELMNAKSWNKEVLGFCPGVGKGRLHSAREIENILEEQAVQDAFDSGRY